MFFVNFSPFLFTYVGCSGHKRMVAVSVLEGGGVCVPVFVLLDDDLLAFC